MQVKQQKTKVAFQVQPQQLSPKSHCASSYLRKIQDALSMMSTDLELCFRPGWPRLV